VPWFTRRPDEVDVDAFHKSIRYALQKLGKSNLALKGQQYQGAHNGPLAVSNFESNRQVGSSNEIFDYPCLGADLKTRGLKSLLNSA